MKTKIITSKIVSTPTQQKKRNDNEDDFLQTANLTIKHQKIISAFNNRKRFSPIPVTFLVF